LYISLFVFFIFLFSIFSGCTENSEIDGEYKSDFSFTKIDGEEVHISSYKGKVVLIDFTGVNCVYCIPQKFVLDDIYNDYNRDEFEIISIYVWMLMGETVTDINNLLAAYRCSSPCDAEEEFNQLPIREYKEYFGKEDGINFNWQVAYDDSKGTLYKKYGQRGIPHIRILDKNGNVYYSNYGFTDYNNIKTRLDKLL